MRHSGFIGLVALVGLLPTVSARAQAPITDATGFRAGQWGAEFSLGTSAVSPTGAGVLHFHSARRALVLDVSGQVSRQSGDIPWTQTQSAARLRLGTRWYRPVSRSVLQSLTLGVLVSREQRELQTVSLPQGPSAQTRSTSTGGGGFAEVGGSWLVTPQLSLGAAWQGNVLYARGTQRTVLADPALRSPDVRTTLWSASLGTLVLRAGVYF